MIRVEVNAPNMLDLYSEEGEKVGSIELADGRPERVYIQSVFFTQVGWSQIKEVIDRYMAEPAERAAVNSPE